MCPGYSNAGVIADVGSEASKFKVWNRAVPCSKHASHVSAHEDLVTADMSFLQAGEVYERLIESGDDTLGIILDWKKTNRDK